MNIDKRVPKVIAIVLILAMFILGGVDKLMNVNKVAIGLQQRTFIGIQPIVYIIVILLVAALEITASSAIIYTATTDKRKSDAKIAIITLAIFTGLATIIYHFPPFGRNYYPFIANISTVGALIFLYKNI